MIKTMSTLSRPNHSSFPFFEKMTEPRLVAYTRFRGVLNAPSRIWMVRDWAKRTGCHLVGPPQCVFYPEGTDPEQQLCEVQWAIAEAAVPDDGEVGLRWSGNRPVIATYHLGKPSTMHDTALALETWGQANGYRLTGASREVYYFDLKAPSDNWITEIQLYVDGTHQEFRGGRR